MFVQQLMAKEIQTFLDFPPMQRGASFNLDAIKAEIQKKMAEAEAAAKAQQLAAGAEGGLPSRPLLAARSVRADAVRQGQYRLDGCDDFYAHEFWRFVFLQQKVGEYAQTFIDYPPMQRGASFNLEAVKTEIEERIKAMKRKMNKGRSSFDGSPPGFSTGRSLSRWGGLVGNRMRSTGYLAT